MQDVNRAGRILQEQGQISEQEKAVQLAVAKIEAQLDRAEVLEKARHVSAQKALDTAAQKLEGSLLAGTAAA